MTKWLQLIYSIFFIMYVISIKNKIKRQDKREEYTGSITVSSFSVFNGNKFYSLCKNRETLPCGSLIGSCFRSCVRTWNKDEWTPSWQLVYSNVKSWYRPCGREIQLVFIHVAETLYLILNSPLQYHPLSSQRVCY